MDHVELHVPNKLQHLGRFAWEGNYPLAQWRLPQSTSTFLLISEHTPLRQVKLDLDELGPGFALSPFWNESSLETLFFPADNLYEATPDSFITHQQLPDDHPFWNKRNATPHAKIHEAIPIPQSDQKEHFVSLVEDAIEAIKQGNMKKIVLSRTMTLAGVTDFQPQEAFQLLCAAYPDAFVAWVYLPDTEEMWLCASPETLVSQDDTQGLFQTMSLAGTQPAFTAQGELIPEIDALWSQKEIEEQALVGRYIIDCFKKVRIREYEEIGPKTHRAGNLLHLKSDFAVHFQDIRFPQITTVMLDLLHPTSAVCGMPKAPAMQFLRERESHDRSFYAGYLGPVHILQKTHLFVHLRTLRWQAHQVTLFAGCGVTADSQPEKEWQETTLKCRTLGNILFPEKMH